MGTFAANQILTSWAELGLSQAGTVSLELKLCSIGLASWG